MKFSDFKDLGLTNIRTLFKIDRLYEVYSSWSICELRNKLPELGQLEKIAALKSVTYQVTGKLLYPSQLLAINEMVNGKVVNMGTGEGKSLVAANAAIIMAYEEYTVIIATCNQYLRDRDYQNHLALFESVGVTSQKLCPMATYDSNLKSVYYADFINDCCLTILEDIIRGDSSTIVNKHFFYNDKQKTSLIIDEIDESLIRSGNTTVSIVSQARTDGVSLSIAEIINSIENSEQYIQHRSTGEQAINDEFYTYISEIIDTTNMDYVIAVSHLKAAFIARFILKLGKDYLVNDGLVHMIDKSTGRTISSNYSPIIMLYLNYYNGLNGPLQNKSLISSNIKSYVNLYSHVSGMSATAACYKNEFKDIYGLKCVIIPKTFNKEIICHGPYLYMDFDVQTAKIQALITDLTNKEQSVLVVCNDDHTANYLNYKLQDERYKTICLTNSNISEEKSILEAAGQSGRVTITTRICARGYDIQMSKESSNFNLIMLGYGVYEADDIQLFGRIGRQGRRGTIYRFLNSSDLNASFPKSSKSANVLLKIYSSDQSRDKLGFEGHTKRLLSFISSNQKVCYKISKNKRYGRMNETYINDQFFNALFKIKCMITSEKDMLFDIISNQFKEEDDTLKLLRSFDSILKETILDNSLKKYSIMIEDFLFSLSQQAYLTKNEKIKKSISKFSDLAIDFTNIVKSEILSLKIKV